MDDDELVRLVAARCGDALTEVELDRLEAAIRQRPAPILLDQIVAEKLFAVIDAIERRLDEMTSALAERAIAQEIEASFIDSAAEVFH